MRNTEHQIEKQNPVVFGSRLGTMAGVSTTAAIGAYDEISQQIAVAIIERNQKAYASNQTKDTKRFELYRWFYLGEPDELDRTFEECLVVLGAEDVIDEFLTKLEERIPSSWRATLKQFLNFGMRQEQLF
jgi:hypothetical protein